MKKIAVLYLARASEGLDKFEHFAASYRQYKAGQNHDLIIIYKGEFKKGEKSGTEHIFSGIPHQSFSISDEGYDIHAYLNVAEKIDHDFTCVFNTHTVLVSQNWLRKLYTHLDKPGVGLVGTSAAYGSHINGLKLIHHVNWLFFNDLVSIENKIELKKYANTFLGYLPSYKRWIVMKVGFGIPIFILRFIFRFLIKRSLNIK